MNRPRAPDVRVSVLKVDGRSENHVIMLLSRLDYAQVLPESVRTRHNARVADIILARPGVLWSERSLHLSTHVKYPGSSSSSFPIQSYPMCVLPM